MLSQLHTQLGLFPVAFPPLEQGYPLPPAVHGPEAGVGSGACVGIRVGNRVGESDRVGKGVGTLVGEAVMHRPVLVALASQQPQALFAQVPVKKVFVGQAQ